MVVVFAFVPFLFYVVCVVVYYLLFAVGAVEFNVYFDQKLHLIPTVPTAIRVAGYHYATVWALGVC